MGISYHSLAVDYRFQGAGTPRKNVAMSSRVCMSHTEEPGTAKSGPRPPNEAEYSFGDFMTSNTRGNTPHLTHPERVCVDCRLISHCECKRVKHGEWRLTTSKCSCFRQSRLLLGHFSMWECHEKFTLTGGRSKARCRLYIERDITFTVINGWMYRHPIWETEICVENQSFSDDDTGRFTCVQLDYSLLDICNSVGMNVALSRRSNRCVNKLGIFSKKYV